MKQTNTQVKEEKDRLTDRFRGNRQVKSKQINQSEKRIRLTTDIQEMEKLCQAIVDYRRLERYKLYSSGR